MEKQSKKIMFIAVVAAIIFIFPVSFYDFLVGTVPVVVSDGFSEFTWRDNFTTSIGYKEAVFPYNNETNTSAIILFNGYPKSSVTLSLYSIEYSNMYEMNNFNFFLNVSGALTSNLHPKNLVISENIKAYSAEKGGFLIFQIQI